LLQQVGKTIGSRLLYKFMDAILKPSTFEAMFLGAPLKHVPPWAGELVSSLGEDAVDVVWLRNPTKLARVKLFASRGGRFFAVVERFKTTMAGAWCATVDDIVVANVIDIKSVCCYAVIGDKIFV
jgi:hypothetical protein